MNRLRMPAAPGVAEDAGRGADAGDLARLRDRIERYEQRQVAEATLLSNEEQARAAREAWEAAEAARIEDHARWLEADTRARWTRILARQSALGIGSFLLARVFFRRGPTNQESSK